MNIKQNQESTWPGCQSAWRCSASSLSTLRSRSSTSTDQKSTPPSSGPLNYNSRSSRRLQKLISHKLADCGYLFSSEVRFNQEIRHTAPPTVAICGHFSNFTISSIRNSLSGLFTVRILTLRKQLPLGLYRHVNGLCHWIIGSITFSYFSYKVLNSSSLSLGSYGTFLFDMELWLTFIFNIRN